MKHFPTRFSSGPSLRQRGWTLLELLVIIAIIAVGATLLVVTSRSIGRKNQEVRCVHNLRQLGVAFLAYTADAQGNVIRSQISGGNLQSGWSRLIVSRGYLGGTKPWEVMQCPSANLPDGARRAMENYDPIRPSAAAGDLWRWYTYGLNMCAIPGANKVWQGFESNGTTEARFFEMPISAVKSPSTHVLFADSSRGPNEHWPCQAMERGNKQGLALQHGEKGNRYANAFFLDGHISRVDRARSVQLATQAYDYGLNLPQVYVFDVE